MTAQDEVVIKRWVSEVRVLVEDLQAQINALRVEMVGLQKVQPTASQKKTAKTEEPVSETK